MVCANCGSDSHRTNQKDCPKYCTLCAQPGHRQKRGTCPFRVCSICHETGHSARECTSKSVGIRDSCDDGTHQQRDNPSDEVCERCQEHGHNETSCSKPRCKACGSSTHKSAISFECPEHKCSNAKARSIRKGTIETIALYRSPLFARSARKSDTKRIDAQRDRVLHVAFERTDYRHITRVLSTYAPHATKRDTIAAIARPLNATHAVCLGTYRTIAHSQSALMSRSTGSTFCCRPNRFKLSIRTSKTFRYHRLRYASMAS